MTRQSEQALENHLLSQLNGLGYSSVQIDDEKALLSNLKTQLEKTQSELPFQIMNLKVLNLLNSGSVFERS